MFVAVDVGGGGVEGMLPGVGVVRALEASKQKRKQGRASKDRNKRNQKPKANTPPVQSVRRRELQTDGHVRTCEAVTRGHDERGAPLAVARIHGIPPF